MNGTTGISIALDAAKPSDGLYSAFYAVHLDGWHICARCTVEIVPSGQMFCQPCRAELRRVVRVTRAGGDAYEGEEE